ncbi:hypothetical protein AGMMS49982_04620 [Bacteroidia bacterium]|nr:hypothetical protein AGMMS49982_04620 [Bacteroidia bacterium]
MSKLYVFGIGGTGSRVLKSLTMLLAAGVKINADEVVPIIIDPDLAAADLTRTVKLMQDYVKVRDRINVDNSAKNSFFKTKINMDIIPSGRIPVQNTKDSSFKEYIGLSLMKDEKGNESPNYALASMLFSQKNLNATMEVGFKGNPNIGSVVLNQFSFSDEFKAFTSSVKADDRIFVISSIFGGTGASGFPLLVKEIRKPKGRNENELIRNVPIGAVTVLPYFDVKNDEDSEIDSTTFISKAKAALSYYDVNLKEVNSLYYIADKETKAYENSEGGATQRNEAHFVELAAALAVVDFAAQQDDSFATIDGRVQNPTYKEFGIKNKTEQIIFNDLCDKTNRTIKKPMTQFLLFCKYLNEQFNESYRIQPWAIDHKIDDNFVSQQYFQSDLAGIKKAYLEWLQEMSNNTRAFSPYDLSEKKNDVYGMIKGELPARLKKIKSNYALFDDELNSIQKKATDSSSKALHYFMELFYLGTEELVKSKFRI